MKILSLLSVLFLQPVGLVHAVEWLECHGMGPNFDSIRVDVTRGAGNREVLSGMIVASDLTPRSISGSITQGNSNLGNSSVIEFQVMDSQNQQYTFSFQVFSATNSYFDGAVVGAQWLDFHVRCYRAGEAPRYSTGFEEHQRGEMTDTYLRPMVKVHDRAQPARYPISVNSQTDRLCRMFFRGAYSLGDLQASSQISSGPVAILNGQEFRIQDQSTNYYERISCEIDGE